MSSKVASYQTGIQHGDGLVMENVGHHGLPQELWPALGRIRMAAAAGVFTLAFFLLPGANVGFMIFLGLCTAVFAGVNYIAQHSPVEQRGSLEITSMLSGLGMNTSLILASGGAKSPLLFVYLFPVFTYGFRLGGRGACSSTLLNVSVKNNTPMAGAGDMRKYT